MHQFLRLIPEGKIENDSSNEHSKLKAVLAKAPGVERVSEIRKDLKGGYAVSLEITENSFESLVQYVVSKGFHPCL